MRHLQSGIGQDTETHQINVREKNVHLEDFVLEKSIFNNIFEKDIRRVFIYKKAERLAKAIHLIAPAFAESTALRNRISTIAVGLVDAAALPPSTARTALSHELLVLSSTLSMARTGGILSSMNVELITQEAHILLQEIAAYEEPRLFLDETLTLSGIAKKAFAHESPHRAVSAVSRRAAPAPSSSNRHNRNQKEQIKDISINDNIKDRREAILSVIKDKKNANIKDISTLIRDVSEKTIQRELLSLIALGEVSKQGERRWSTYSLA